MGDKKFAQTPSYDSKHPDQEAESLMVKNYSKYLANLWELIAINRSMI